MNPNLAQPDACDCDPVPGASHFPAGTKECEKPEKADLMIFRFDYLARDPTKIDALPPEELNNIACYLLWRANVSEGNLKMAHDLLQKARRKAIKAGEEAKEDKDKAKYKALKKKIEANLGKFRSWQPDVPRGQPERMAVAQGIKDGTLRAYDDWATKAMDGATSNDDGQ